MQDLLVNRDDVLWSVTGTHSLSMEEIDLAHNYPFAELPVQESNILLLCPRPVTKKETQAQAPLHPGNKLHFFVLCTVLRRHYVTWSCSCPR